MRTTILAVLVLFSISAFSQDFKNIGASKCKMCHSSQYKLWTDSKHSKAFSILTGPNATNKECLSCHSMEQTFQSEGVSCEMCHGSGSAYKSPTFMKNINLAKKNGLITPDEKLCKKCHNEKSPNYKGFDYPTALAKISHKKI